MGDRLLLIQEIRPSLLDCQKIIYTGSLEAGVKSKIAHYVKSPLNLDTSILKKKQPQDAS